MRLFPVVAHKPAETLLRVSNLTLANRSFEGVDFHARAGEITGIAGLVG